MQALYSLKPEIIAERTGVDVSTARRWKSGAVRVPKSAAMILEADLGCFAREWRGWCLNGGELVSPEGWRISLGQVLNVPLMRQQLAAYQAALRAKENDTLSRLEEQPLPENWNYTAAG
jgi:hypothetical protein